MQSVRLFPVSNLLTLLPAYCLLLSIFTTATFLEVKHVSFFVFSQFFIHFVVFSSSLCGRTAPHGALRRSIFNPYVCSLKSGAACSSYSLGCNADTVDDQITYGELFSPRRSCWTTVEQQSRPFEPYYLLLTCGNDVLEWNSTTKQCVLGKCETARCLIIDFDADG